ncbi:PREDICTED: membrane-spanning 4-domains subfamily A member 12 [Chrysochloris asiatica]|uniref:Membrane-spanning 4-domains subfamily A member 12 n=1 Tax=Chrysochloris asiatica TaxID=185453 RepID=A0A9B0U665_CHRAS|nr:PREDICTED: membrane-spanning 4-domains subfamily A member 12 [Chrysochloris asiatica]
MSEPTVNPPRNIIASWTQQLQNVINQAQGGQRPVFTTSGISAGFQQGQENIQMVNVLVETGKIYFKDEAKILGGIQIMIGLLHFGFGIILALLTNPASNSTFTSLSFISGYVFWGGISFVISGSLSILAYKTFSSCLMNSNVGMNIVSAIFTFIGIILLLVDMCINGITKENYSSVISGIGISAMLMIFALVEISINCASAFFAFQAIPYTIPSVIVVPTVYGNSTTSAPSSVPLRNDDQPVHAPGRRPGKVGMGLLRLARGAAQEAATVVAAGAVMVQELAQM